MFAALCTNTTVADIATDIATDANRIATDIISIAVLTGIDAVPKIVKFVADIVTDITNITNIADMTRIDAVPELVKFVAIKARDATFRSAIGSTGPRTTSKSSSVTFGFLALRGGVASETALASASSYMPGFLVAGLFEASSVSLPTASRGAFLGRPRGRRTGGSVSLDLGCFLGRPGPRRGGSGSGSESSPRPLRLEL